MRKLNWSQFGIMNMNYKLYSLDYFLDGARDMGVKNINLWAAAPHLYLGDATDDGVREIRKKIEDRGMSCFCVCPEQVVYPFNIAAEDDRIRDNSIATMKRAAEVCELIGSPLLHICPGWGFYDKPEKLSVAWERARDAMIEISDKAAEHGVTMILEPLQTVESNLVVDVASARKMLDEVSRPNFKLMVDTCHMQVRGETLDEYFDEFGKDIAHIHFNESDQVPWGFGTLPMREYLDQIEAHDFEGTLTLEVCSWAHYIEPNKTVGAGVDCVRKAVEVD